MLYEFRDKQFLQYKKWWFVWEPAWEGFRPIDGIQWDGTSFVLQESAYCSDPMSPFYGYGSPQMRQLCGLLPKESTPCVVSTLPIGNEWLFDRFVALTPCAPRDKSSWKRMVQNKGRTCRKAPRGKKCTRRRRS